MDSKQVIMVSNELIPDQNNYICSVDPSLVEEPPPSTGDGSHGMPAPENAFAYPESQFVWPTGQFDLSSNAPGMLPPVQKDSADMPVASDPNKLSQSLATGNGGFPMQNNLQSPPGSVDFSLDPAWLQADAMLKPALGFPKLPSDPTGTIPSQQTSLPTPPSDTDLKPVDEVKLKSTLEDGQESDSDTNTIQDGKVKVEEDEDLEMEEAEENEDRDHKRLRKNRIAARKCRRRKKHSHKKLEAREHELHVVHDELSAHVSELRNELFDLKSEVLRHADCNSDLIDRYLESEARRIQ